jgi:ATP-dependent Lon protease
MIQDRPFPMMELDYLEPVPAEEALAAGRMQQVRALCRKMREPTAKEADQVDEHLAEIESAELLCDVVANTFIGAAHRRQQLLEELDVSRRLILLTTFLLAELGG